MDPYTLPHCYAFDLLCYHSELHGSCGKAKGQCFELVGFVLKVETHVLPGLAVYGYVEVRIFKIYGSHPLPCLEGGSYCLWGLHVERLCFQIIVQFAQIQDRVPPVVGLWYTEQLVVKTQGLWILNQLYGIFV